MTKKKFVTDVRTNGQWTDRLDGKNSDLDVRILNYFIIGKIDKSFCKFESKAWFSDTEAHVQVSPKNEFILLTNRNMKLVNVIVSRGIKSGI